MKDIMITGTMKDGKTINLSEIDMENITAMKALRLSAMKEEYMRLVDTGEICTEPVEKIINRLLVSQTMKRLQNTTQKRIKKANLWYEEASVINLEAENISADRNVLNNVLRFNFIKAGSVVNITGGTRTGKTFLACAIGAKACEAKIDTLYIRFAALIKEGYRSPKEHDLLIDLNYIRNVDLLIIDDFAQTEEPLTVEEKDMIKDLMDYRKRGKGTMFVSSRNVDGWIAKLNIGKNKGAAFKQWFNSGQTLHLGASPLTEEQNS